MLTWVGSLQGERSERQRWHDLGEAIQTIEPSSDARLKVSYASS